MKKYFFILILAIFAIGGIIIADNFGGGIRLEEGKNIINVGIESNPIYVTDLIKLYPEINTITYNESGEEKGYVNAFGGIGENFIIYPNQTYEIIAKKEVILNLG